MSIQLIAIDIDGTLLPSAGTEISARNRQALLEAEAAGIEVVIATGRRQAYSTPLILSVGLKLETVMITSNGTVTRTLDGERMAIGRRPDSAVFLDDITVSRDHALLIRRGDDWYLDDCGSLNGTYVNRERIESHRLDDADELQIGKYKLTYHAR